MKTAGELINDFEDAIRNNPEKYKEARIALKERLLSLEVKRRNDVKPIYKKT